MRINHIATIAFVMSLAACAQGSGSPESPRSTANTTAYTLEDNFPATRPADAEVGSLYQFVKAYRDSYASGSFDGLFADDFAAYEFRSITRDRSAFLAERRRMKGVTVRSSVRAIEVDGDRAIIRLIQQYQSEIFAPILAEEIYLVRRADRWIADKMLSAPVTVNEDGQKIVPKAHIFLISGSEAINFTEDLDIRELEKMLIDRDRSSIPGTEYAHDLIVVFTTPPKPGARIRIQHQFWRPWAKSLSPYQFNYVARPGQIYYLIKNGSQAGGAGGHITYTVEIDGIRSGKKRVSIR